MVLFGELYVSKHFFSLSLSRTCSITRITSGRPSDAVVAQTGGANHSVAASGLLVSLSRENDIKQWITAFSLLSSLGVTPPPPLLAVRLARSPSSSPPSAWCCGFGAVQGWTRGCLSQNIFSSCSLVCVVEHWPSGSHSSDTLRSHLFKENEIHLSLVERCVRTFYSAINLSIKM